MTRKNRVALLGVARTANWEEAAKKLFSVTWNELTAEERLVADACIQLAILIYEASESGRYQERAALTTLAAMLGGR